LCSSSIKTSTLFSKPYLPFHKSQKIKLISKKCKRSARLRCLNRHVKKGDLINCVFDLCNGFRGKMIRKFEKNIRHDKRRWETAFKKNHRVKRKFHFQSFHRRTKHHRKHSRSHFVKYRRHSKRRNSNRVHRSGIVRRGGRGAIWLQGKHHRWFNVKAVGTFDYLIDNKNNLKIQVQFGKLGKGSVIRSVAVSYKGKKIVAEKDGSVYVDEKIYEAPSAEFNFENDQFNIKPDNSGFGIYTFTGISRESFKIHYEKDSKSYVILIQSTAKHHLGLYVKPKHARRYQVQKEASLFKKFIPFRFLNAVVQNENNEKEAKECCHKLKNETKRKECKIDFIRTGSCLIQQYKEDLEF